MKKIKISFFGSLLIDIWMFLFLSFWFKVISTLQGFLIISKPLEGAFSKKRVCKMRERERSIEIGIFLLISPRALNSIFHFLDQNGVDMYIQIHPKRIDLIRLPHFSTDTKLYFFKGLKRRIWKNHGIFFRNYRYDFLGIKFLKKRLIYEYIRISREIK